MVFGKRKIKLTKIFGNLLTDGFKGKVFSNYSKCSFEGKVLV